MPYRDFTLEYPPGFLPVLLLPRQRINATTTVSASLCSCLARRQSFSSLSPCFSREPRRPSSPSGYSCRDPAAHADAGALLRAFRSWPAVLVLLAVVALLRERRALSLVALAVGAAAKLYLLALVPLAVMTRRGALTCAVTWQSWRPPGSHSRCRLRSSPRAASATSAGCLCGVRSISRVWAGRSCSPRTGSAFTTRRSTSASAPRGPRGAGRESRRRHRLAGRGPR